MWFVLLFKLFYFIIREFDVERGDGLIKMFHFGCADDRRRDMRLVQYPCQGNLRSGYIVIFRNFPCAVSHHEILIAEIQTIPKRIVIGTFCFSASATFAIPREEAACHWAPWNETNTLIDTQWNHLAFFLTINQIVVILH